MSFDINCPNCSSVLSADENWIGLEADCPDCGTPVKIEKKQKLSIKREVPESSTASTAYRHPEIMTKKRSFFSALISVCTKFFVALVLIATFCASWYLGLKFYDIWQLRKRVNAAVSGEGDINTLPADLANLAYRGTKEDEYKCRQLQASLAVGKPGCYKIKFRKKEIKAVPLPENEARFKVTECAWGGAGQYSDNVWINFILINNSLDPLLVTRDDFMLRTDNNVCQRPRVRFTKKGKTSVKLDPGEGMKGALYFNKFKTAPRTLEFNNGRYVLRNAILEHCWIGNYKITVTGRPAQKALDLFPIFGPLSQYLLSSKQVKKLIKQQWEYPSPPDRPKLVEY